MRLMVTLATVTALLAGCSTTLQPRHLAVFEDSSLDYVPGERVQICVLPELDYAGYAEMAGRYDLTSIQEALQVQLQCDPIVLQKPIRDGLVPKVLTRSVPALYEVVEHEGEADLTVQITIEALDFGDQRSLGGKILRYNFLGGFGLLGTGEQALIAVSYEAKLATSGAVVAQGLATHLSGEGLVPRLAYAKVLELATQTVLDVFVSL